MSYCENCGRPIPTGETLCSECSRQQSGAGKTPKPKKAGGAAPVIVMSAALAAVLLLFAAALIFGTSGASAGAVPKTLAPWEGSGAETETDAGPETVKIAAPYASGLTTAPADPEPESETAGEGVEEGAEGSTEYILPGSDSAYISREVIAAMTKEELRLARNEIYARHGRIFDDPALANYFSSKSWYQPLYDGATFDAMGDSVLNQYEIANRDLIVEYERAYS